MADASSAQASRAETESAALPPPTPAVRRRLQEMYERGSKLASQGDRDYALTMFVQCAAKDPASVLYLDALFDILRRSKKKGGGLLSFGANSAIKRAAGKGEWQKVLELGPTLLAASPADVAVLRLLAEACEAVGCFDSELRYLRYAVEMQGRDKPLLIHFANSLTRLGQFKQAISCWGHIEQLDPKDPVPPQKISELAIDRARPREDSSGGKSAAPSGSKAAPRIAPEKVAAESAKPATSGDDDDTITDSASSETTDTLPNNAAAAGTMAAAGQDGAPTSSASADVALDGELLEEAAEKTGEQIGEPAGGEATDDVTDDATVFAAKPDEIERLHLHHSLQQALRDNPADVAAARRLAKISSEQGQFDEAESILEQARAAGGANLGLLEQLEDVQLERADSELEVARRRVQAGAGAEEYKLVEKLNENLHRLELEILGVRSQRYPNDRQMRLDLGQRLKKAGRHAQAIEEFQAAREDLLLKPQATLEMGECFQHLRQYDKAVKCYTRATTLSERPAGDLFSDSALASTVADETLKRSLYRLGVLLTGLGRAAEATDRFQQLVEIDPSYKDAEERLRKAAGVKE